MSAISFQTPSLGSAAEESDTWLSKDDESVIRIKMLALFAFTALFSIPQSIGRLGLICSGHWAWGQAYPEALREWRIANHNKENPSSKKELYLRTAELALFYFADATIKCLTLPLSVALKMGATLIAIIDPFLARRTFGKIEELWSLRLNAESHPFFTLISYQAPCMQPKRVWDQLNWYRRDLQSSLTARSIRSTKSSNCT